VLPRSVSIYADVVPALRRPSLAEYHQLLSGRRVRACQLVRVQRVMPPVPGEARFNTDPIEIVTCKSRQLKVSNEAEGYAREGTRFRRFDDSPLAPTQGS
jgi:hypothetical protein